MYTVYWIFDDKCHNPNKDGYVGITTQNLEARYKDHLGNRKNKHLKHRCRNANTKIKKLVSGLSKEEAQKLELELRPVENIGCNIAKGRDIPPSRKGITYCALRGDARTQAQKDGQKSRSKKIMGNTFRLGKFKKTTKMKTFFCNNCGEEKKSWNQYAKFCSRKCAGIVNKNPKKRKILSQRAKEQWKRQNE